MENHIKIPTIGEVLNEEFLIPLKISQNSLSKAIGVPQNRISDIINGKRGITVDTDLRLTKYFGLSEGFFVRMQIGFERMEIKRKIKQELNLIVPLKHGDLSTKESLTRNYGDT
ncbi:MAG: HigA family addiction module antitoxin [Leptospirales bacterium]|nr:HigA family addiction module antitoxin [Leptospirales bacterium]